MVARSSGGIAGRHATTPSGIRRQPGSVGRLAQVFPVMSVVVWVCPAAGQSPRRLSSRHVRSIVIKQHRHNNANGVHHVFTRGQNKVAKSRPRRAAAMLWRRSGISPSPGPSAFIWAGGGPRPRRHNETGAVG